MNHRRCVSASDQSLHEKSFGRFAYMPGAGDDEENWAMVWCANQYPFILSSLFDNYLRDKGIPDVCGQIGGSRIYPHRC